jgi:TPR repeat protein
VRNRKAIILHALVTLSALAGGSYFILTKPVFAQQQPVLGSRPEADLQIKSLLKKLEALLGQDQTSSAETVGILISVGELLPSASDTGQQLMQEFPQQLRARAKELRDDGRLTKSIDYEAFAEVAALYTNGHQQSGKPATDVRTNAAKPPAPVPDATALVPLYPDPSALPSTVQRTLLERGDAMLQQRNVAAARMLFARAANSGVGIAALKLANTYDPGFIAERNLIGIKGDPQEAEAWYRKAAALGEKQAEQRLKSLEGQRKTVAKQ